MERRIVESTLFAFLLFDSSSSSSSSSSWNGTKALSSLSWFYPCVLKRPNNRDTHFFPSPLTIVSRIRLFPAAFFVSIFDPFIRANNSKKIHPSKVVKFLSLFFFLNHVSKIWNLNGERGKNQKWNKTSMEWLLVGGFCRLYGTNEAYLQREIGTCVMAGLRIVYSWAGLSGNTERERESLPNNLSPFSQVSLDSVFQFIRSECMYKNVGGERNNPVFKSEWVDFYLFRSNCNESIAFLFYPMYLQKACFLKFFSFYYHRTFF